MFFPKTPSDSLLRNPKTIPESTPGLDPIPNRTGLGPQPPYMHVYGSGLNPIRDMSLNAPGTLQKLLAALGAPFPFQ